MKVNTLKGAGVVVALLGLLLAAYAQFVFDPSLSPLDTQPDYAAVGESGSPQERADAVQDLVDRYQRTVAGERTVNLGRLAEQQRIFYFGLLMILIGGGVFVVGARQPSRNDDDDSEEYL